MAAIAVSATIEVIARPELNWRPIQYLFTLAIGATLLWRRTHPFLMVTIAFGMVLANSVAFHLVGETSEGLYTTVFMLLLPYALLRWGPGRHIVPGVLLMLAAATLGLVTGEDGVGAAIGGISVLLFPAELGAAIRYQSTSRARRAEQIRLLEREQLARELHDTVAHHVSAIAIQAQAGRAVAGADPAAAIRALETIEDESSRSLAEMRAMVGVLRNSSEPELAPQRGIADIDGLARTAGDGPSVSVEISGELDDLRPSIDAAIYRLAQESITNARRHARHATTITVRVAGNAERVRLTVSDDGDANLLAVDR
ncbi:MAG: sensor histidine kinase, partial [bacterium]|nr:sensor histidine kinase [bacterium]